jgi:hypothetical protein
MPVIVGGRAFPPLASVPQTKAEVEALRARREELSNQLQSASRRREQLVQELRRSEVSTRPGLEQRLKVLDDRLAQLESDIAETGRLLASTPAHLLVSTTQIPGPIGGLSSGQATAIGIVGTIFVLCPLAIAFAIKLLRRGARQAMPQQAPEESQRLERIEQAMDAMAIEIERVSEGQRFVTKLLTEGAAQPLSLGVGESEPVSVRRHQS